MRPRSREVAERLLVITLALEQAVLEDDPGALSGLLGERDRVLRELEECPADLGTLETLSRVRVAENRVLAKLGDLRTAALLELSRGRAERKATRTYATGTGSKGGFDEAR